MELEVGKSYRFWKNIQDYAVIKVLEIIEKQQDFTLYQVKVLESRGPFSSKGSEGMINTKGSLFKNYQINKINAHPMLTAEMNEETDLLAKMEFVDYDPKNIPLFIDMALQTRDFDWLKELLKTKEEYNNEHVS